MVDWNKQRLLCEQIAREVHAEHARRDGSPYIEHPRRVAEACGEDHAAACTAWLHDVIEDSGLTEKALMERGVHPGVAKSVSELTRGDEEEYEAYILRLKGGHSAARTVKVCDMVDNLTDAPTANQIAKYRKALVLLAG